MRLTEQMKAEIDSISKYITEIGPNLPLLRSEILGGRLSSNGRIYIDVTAEQLSSHKVRLENLLCETDLKE